MTPSDSPPAEPRTEAGRALLSFAAYDGIAMVAARSLLNRILAVEAEAARPPAAPDAVRDAVIPASPSREYQHGFHDGNIDSGFHDGNFDECPNTDCIEAQL